jgi:hypothetical protein
MGDKGDGNANVVKLDALNHTLVAGASIAAESLFVVYYQKALHFHKVFSS